jgi:hypothetical protein
MSSLSPIHTPHTFVCVCVCVGGCLARLWLLTRSVPTVFAFTTATTCRVENRRRPRGPSRFEWTIARVHNLQKADEAAARAVAKVVAIGVAWQ